MTAQGWDEVPLPGGGLTGLLRGYELHVVLHREGVITRRTLREYLGPLLERLGMLTTRVPAEDAAGRRFVERLGFEFTGEEGGMRHYLLHKVPFQREAKQCQ